MSLVTQYVTLAICLVLSGFFSGAEIAYVGLTRVRIHEMVKKGRKNAEMVLHLKERLDKLIITILIGNNLVNILASALATRVALETFGDAGVGIAVGVITLFVLVFGEIIPKNFAANHAEQVALKSAKIFTFLQWLFTPLVFMLGIINNAILHAFGVRQQTTKITERDVLNTIALSATDGGINSQERELLRNVFDFDDSVVEEIMTPREQVLSISHDATFNEAVELMIEHGFSRVPVYKGHVDNIIGTLFIKDALKVLAAGKSLKTLRTLVENPFFVPETQPIFQLLRDFQKRRTHMAIAVNEYGGVVGIVTMEDLLEELVGEIYDETDALDNHIRKVSEKEFIVNGDCAIETFNEKVTNVLPVDDDYLTVAGLVIKKLEHLPRPGERLILKNATLIVKKASDKKVDEIRVRLKKPDQSTSLPNS